VFGFIFLVRSFSFFLDSFHNKIRQKLFLFIRLQTKWRLQFSFFLYTASVILVPCPIMVPIDVCGWPAYTSVFSQNSSVFIVIFNFERLRCVQFGTLDESFQNHYLAGTRVTVKLALWAGPSGQLVKLTITVHKHKKALNKSYECACINGLICLSILVRSCWNFQ
jgi:hypothetical protein